MSLKLWSASAAFTLITAAAYAGVTNAPSTQSSATVRRQANGSWNSRDHTGSPSVDNALSAFAAANSNNPIAIVAVEQVAADIRADPSKYLNAGGNPHMGLIRSAIAQRLRGVANIDFSALGH